jgi:hypothetical protein
MHYDTDIWRAVEQFGDLAVLAARRMPKDLKPVLGNRLVDISTYMSVLVRDAAIARGQAKVPIYDELLAAVDLSQNYLRRAFNNRGLGPKLCARCMPVTVSIARQANGLKAKFLKTEHHVSHSAP